MRKLGDDLHDVCERQELSVYAATARRSAVLRKLRSCMGADLEFAPGASFDQDVLRLHMELLECTKECLNSMSQLRAVRVAVFDSALGGEKAPAAFDSGDAHAV